MRKYRRILAFLCALVIAMAPLHMDFVSRAKSTQDKIDEAEKEKEELEKEQKENEEELNGLKEEHKTLQGQLSELNTQLEEVTYHLEDLNDQIILKEKDIVDAQAALDEVIAEEEYQYACMVIRVRNMYEKNDASILNAILTAGGLEDMLNAAVYYERIVRYDRRKMQELKDTQAYISDEKARLEAEYAELDELKLEAEAESVKVAELIEETKNVILKYQDDITKTEKEIEEYEAAIKEKEADLEYLYKKLEEEKKMSQLAANSTWRSIGEVSFEDGDRYLLANLIYCEAGGEPYEGQVAVGAVVMNRVMSSVYPDTVTGVIYQPYQFSPAGSGRLALALAQNKATDSCYKAADEAMSGYTNVGNCLYFRTPIPGLTGISIGGHIFY